MSAIRDFFRPQRLGFHLVLAVIVTIILFIAAIIGLSVYTRHGSEFEMPDYIGRNSDSLMATNPDGFIFVVRNVLYDKEKPEGTVLEQDPLPGEMVKSGRKIYLTCSSTVPPTVAMPQLAGDITLRQAITILENNGLVLEKVIYTESDNVNLVLEQYYKGRPIAKGTVINKGSKITLEVGARLTDIVPDSLRRRMEDINIDYDADAEDGEGFYYNME